MASFGSRPPFDHGGLKQQQRKKSSRPPPVFAPENKECTLYIGNLNKRLTECAHTRFSFLSSFEFSVGMCM